MKRVLVGLAMLTSLFVSAQEQSDAPKAISTDSLVTTCGDKNSSGRVTCSIYLQGVYDYYLVTRSSRNEPEYICVNQPAPPREQIVDEFVMWARSKPESGNKPAANEILQFLAGRFPCKNNATTIPSKASAYSNQNTQSNVSLDEAKTKCAELGLKKGTDQFGKCVLRLSQ